jgi:hypothetical protein
MIILALSACAKSPAVQAVHCRDPVAGCRLDAGMEVRFSKIPAVMRRFDLDVIAPESAAPYASFQMQGMEMGLNRYRLLWNNGKWHAEAMLPACVQGRHDWILRLEAGGKIYAMPFTGG